MRDSKTFRGIKADAKSHHKNKAAKKARYLANRERRAQLYAQFDGAVPGGREKEWHTTLDALSGGTA